MWGTSARISAYGNITNGTYWVGATVSSTDYYFKANGGIATSDNNLSGTSTTNPMTDGTVVKITISSTAQNSKTGTVQFLNGNHMFLPASAAKYKSQTSSATWTFTTASSKIRMTNNSRVLQKNSGASLNFGSYASGQIDVWLEPARKVKYDGNGNTGGKAPDSTFYLTSATVTVASNSGSLVKTGYTFSGWNTQPDGNGTNYTVGSGTFTITADKTLYAKWTADASCESNPSIGDASLNGSFNMTSTTSAIGVASGTCSTGNAACDWTDYGFVWSDGTTTTTPTVSNNKVQVGTTGSGTSWTGSVTPSNSTTPTSWTTGHTYYVRTYGKNSKTGAEFAYGNAWSFTPRSITFNLNGHGSSTPSTQYVNSGSKASDPSYSESVSGWVFGGWFREAECTNEWTFGTDVVSKDTTLYAKWTQKCSTPTFSPAAGTHTGTQSVTISCAAPSNATIRYTTDGTTPTKSVGTVYSEAISVSATTTIQAIAYKDGCLDSEVASGIFTIKCATPTFSVAAGTKHGAQSVELSCATADATIYYTTNNSTPTASSTEYTGTAIDVSTSQTIKAIAIKSGLSNSEVASAAYTIQYQVTWTVNGDDDDITPTWVNCGTKPTLPDAPDACDATSTTFIGWTQTRWDDKIAQSAIDDKTTDATKVHTSNSTMPNVEGNVTYHAVWAKGSSSPSNEWGLVKSTSSLSNGDKVIFAHVGSGSAYLMSKDTVTEAGYEYRKYTTSTFSISTEKITITSVATDKTDKTKPHALTVGKSGDYWTFYDGLNSGYINCGGTALIDKNLLCYQAILTDAGKWALSINSTTGEASVTSQTSETDRNLLKRNGTTNTGIFSCYKSTSNDVYNPYIFKNLSTTSYSDYMTTCCDYHVTVNDPSITDAASSGSTITFDKTHPATCNGGATVQATLTLAAGYQASALSFTRSDDDDVSVSPAISTPITSTTVYTLTFGDEDNITLSTSATIQAKPVSSWTWTYGGEALPNPVNLYVGEKARFDVEYTPLDVVLSKKTYTRTKVDAYINWVGDVYANYFYCSGRASTGENTTPVTVTHADGPETTIYVKVKALPTVTFVDLIHNKTDFTNSGDGWTAGTGVLSSTASSGVVSHAKKTPTHADVSAPVGGNTCETEHLHLIGWIRSDWPALVAYMNGTGSASDVETEDITGAGADGDSKNYFFSPDADINVETYNGKTFYAVWAVEE